MGCHLLHDVASKIHTGTTLSLLKADRLEAYPTFAMVGCAAKPASPTLRKTSKPLGPPSPPGLWLGGEGAGGVRGMTARKARWAVEIRLLGFSPEGGTSLPVCVSHRTLATTQPFYIFPMRKHLFQILRNYITILFSKHLLGR